jgi:hypothetical protein
VYFPTDVRVRERREGKTPRATFESASGVRGRHAEQPTTP